MEKHNPGTDPQAVTTMTKPADDQLAAQVNALVQQNVQNGSRDIQVVIKNGVVTLMGRIPTDEQKELLEKEIKALPGVDRVQDSMITGTE
jgi:osmotically-inducible protein OsmY